MIRSQLQNMFPSHWDDWDIVHLVQQKPMLPAVRKCGALCERTLTGECTYHV